MAGRGMGGVGALRRFKLGKSPADVDAALRGLVHESYVRVPFYRHLWDAAGVDVAAFRGAIDLPQLPIVTKQLLLAHELEERMARGADPARTARRSTSGTSGAPIEIHMSRDEFRFRRLALLVAMWGDARWAVPLTLVEAGAWIPPDGLGRVLIRRSPVGSVVYISRRIPVQDQVGELARRHPTVLTGSPSCLQVIAEELERWSGGRVRPRLVVARGEVLRPDIRQLLGRVFGCRVADYYNAQEVGNIARECRCEAGILHVNHDVCVVEAVDEDGRALRDGQEGRVVVTNLYNRTMPFVRYALGDRVALLHDSAARCACGRGGLRMVAPSGREDDLVLLPDGQRISPRVIDDLVIGAMRRGGLETPFVRGVREYQIVQESARRIRVLFESRDELPVALAEKLRADVRALYPALDCEVDRVAVIGVGTSGKRKRVVSRIEPGP